MGERPPETAPYKCNGQPRQRTRNCTPKSPALTCCRVGNQAGETTFIRPHHSSCSRSKNSFSPPLVPPPFSSQSPACVCVSSRPVSRMRNFPHTVVAQPTAIRSHPRHCVHLTRSSIEGLGTLEKDVRYHCMHVLYLCSDISQNHVPILPVYYVLRPHLHLPHLQLSTYSTTHTLPFAFPSHFNQVETWLTFCGLTINETSPTPRPLLPTPKSPQSNIYCTLPYPFPSTN